MAESAVADHNTTTTATAAAKLVISYLSYLLPILLDYAIQIVKLTPFLATYLLKFLAACFDELRAHLLSSLDEILPPGKRIDTLHHYLITAKNEISTIVKYYFDLSVAKFDEIYPLVKQYFLIISEISVRFLQGCCDHLVNRFDDAFPPGERADALWKYTEAGKQYMSIRSEVLTEELNSYFDFSVAKFHEIYPHVKQYILIKFDEAGKQYLEIKSGDWTVELKRFLGCIVHNLNEVFDVEEETVKLVVTVCIVGWICFVCVRLCCRGRGKMMTAPGRGGRVQIPRNVFEGNPKGYFRSLRGRS